MSTTVEVVRLIEGMLGQALDHKNVYYGSLLPQQRAAWLRRRDETDLHQRLAAWDHAWNWIAFVSSSSRMGVMPMRHAPTKINFLKSLE